MLVGAITVAVMTLTAEELFNAAEAAAKKAFYR
jgi:hypothetical protein